VARVALFGLKNSDNLSVVRFHGTVWFNYLNNFTFNPVWADFNNFMQVNYVKAAVCVILIVIYKVKYSKLLVPSDLGDFGPLFWWILAKISNDVGGIIY